MSEKIAIPPPKPRAKKEKAPEVEVKPLPKPRAKKEKAPEVEVKPLPKPRAKKEKDVSEKKKRVPSEKQLEVLKKGQEALAKRRAEKKEKESSL